MYQYQYQFGDRPLEGYTIQRAVGRGGFGEVYFAISDSGRQVALKVVQNHEQIELRGITQCMNLKNPHLVTIFDVKHNDKGKPFVLMEYVSGMSLRDLLDESPGGIGPQKAAFFLREIAKGLSFLHECGIVHRDLKPSNVFFENGCVKVGDYGLAKAISSAGQSEQTVTVGTVHYMAPEIGEGRYDLSIDIYALGIVLYEMLTGQVPFFGASPAEILMKHMTAPPDLTGIEEPFARTIAKALAKDPAQRYKTVQELVEDVFGQEHIRNSVSQFSPCDLSVIARHVAEKAKARASAESPAPGSGKAGQAGQYRRTQDMAGLGEQIGRKVGSAADKVAENVAKVASGFEKHLTEQASGPDQVGRRQRRIVAFVVMAVISLLIGLLSGDGRGDAVLGIAFTSLLMTCGLSIGVLWADRQLLMGLEPGRFRDCVTVGFGILLAFILSAVMWLGAPSDFDRHAVGTFISMAALGFVQWPKLTSPGRRQRIDWEPVVGIAGIGLVASLVLGGLVLMSSGVIAGTIIAVQLLSVFEPQSGTSSRQPPPPQPTGDSPGLADPAIPVPNTVSEAQSSPAGTLEDEATASKDQTPTKEIPMSCIESPPVAMPAPPSRRRSFLAGLLAFVGYLVLVLALVVGLIWAIHLPWLVAAGIPDPRLVQDLDRQFGYTGWPDLVDRIICITWTILMLFSMTAVVIARRRRGIAHMLRAVSGTMLLGSSSVCLYAAMPPGDFYLSGSFIDQAQLGRFGPAVNQLLDAVNMTCTLGAVAAFVLAMTILVWPAGDRRERKYGSAYDKGTP